MYSISKIFQNTKALFSKIWIVYERIPLRAMCIPYYYTERHCTYITTYIVITSNFMQHQYGEYVIVHTFICINVMDPSTYFHFRFAMVQCSIWVIIKSIKIVLVQLNRNNKWGKKHKLVLIFSQRNINKKKII